LAVQFQGVGVFSSPFEKNKNLKLVSQTTDAELIPQLKALMNSGRVVVVGFVRLYDIAYHYVTHRLLPGLIS
jgi:hypothetical protein